MTTTPTIGRVVLVPMDPATNNGADVAPAIITRVWTETMVNVRVLGDRNDVEWRTSLRLHDERPADVEGTHHAWWPPRVG